jgi:spore germination protein GerM
VTHPVSRWRRLALVLLAVLPAAAGCGVPLDSTPRDINDVRLPYRSGAPANPTAGQAIERLCFVQNGKLVRAIRQVPTPRQPPEKVSDLLAGPTAKESDIGYTTALTATSGLAVRVDGGRATVDVGGGRLAEGLGTDDVLAYGQIVCTLTGQGEIGTVTFTSDGQPLSVPRADASLTDGPVTIADYVALLAP